MMSIGIIVFAVIMQLVFTLVGLAYGPIYMAGAIIMGAVFIGFLMYMYLEEVDEKEESSNNKK